ncbi:helitron_like_N domain-containing protein [Trichonephila clavata]|uniref:Helitron_like_N domain-containing protein n=1 Tax=Trichonephila clavata TaxID=2740835 RepID=A0A8X6JNQ8_TRICU|nr:helitron_like_N domain-containing protein [Trichonephila clavata]
MDLITKNHIYGETHCWTFSIEWQTKGLPHIHVSIRLVEKIVLTQIEDIIKAELPDPEEDPRLFEIFKNNMIHGSCLLHNPHSPCMKDEKLAG